MTSNGDMLLVKDGIGVKANIPASGSGIFSMPGAASKASAPVNGDWLFVKDGKGFKSSYNPGYAYKGYGGGPDIIYAVWISGVGVDDFVIYEPRDPVTLSPKGNPIWVPNSVNDPGVPGRDYNPSTFGASTTKFYLTYGNYIQEYNKTTPFANTDTHSIGNGLSGNAAMYYNITTKGYVYYIDGASQGTGSMDPGSLVGATSAGNLDDLFIHYMPFPGGTAQTIKKYEFGGDGTILVQTSETFMDAWMLLIDKCLLVNLVFEWGDPPTSGYRFDKDTLEPMDLY